jgi:hypothetical protein
MICAQLQLIFCIYLNLNLNLLICMNAEFAASSKYERAYRRETGRRRGAFPKILYAEVIPPDPLRARTRRRTSVFDVSTGPR